MTVLKVDVRDVKSARTEAEVEETQDPVAVEEAVVVNLTKGFITLK